MKEPLDPQTTVGEWREQTFPNATVASILSHLEEEIQELIEAARRGDMPAVTEEAADCQLLLWHLAHYGRFSLRNAALQKFLAVRDQQWEPAPGGYWKRVKARGRL